jgi:hypothetical protein
MIIICEKKFRQDFVTGQACTFGTFADPNSNFFITVISFSITALDYASRLIINDFIHEKRGNRPCSRLKHTANSGKSGAKSVTSAA